MEREPAIEQRNGSVTEQHREKKSGAAAGPATGPYSATGAYCWKTGLYTRAASVFVASFLGLSSCRAQQAAVAAPAVPAAQISAFLQPTLNELRSTVAGLRISKWKAPGPVKDEALGNTGSIDRDLQNTLPSLLAQADAVPESVADSFAVYRNLNALYEVLLRVSGTAELAAPDDEAANLAHSLLTLDAGRRMLADLIVTASHAQQAALVQARQQPAPAPPAAAPATTVVSDGPAAAPASAHRKPKAKPKAAAPPTPTPQM